MRRPGILFLTMAMAMAYGVLHDQFTARLCVEYFTVAHPPLFRTHSPTLLALGWGALAAGQVGVLLGVLLAAVAASPNLPPVSWGLLVRRLSLLFAVSAMAAVAAGGMGWHLAHQSMVAVPIEWRTQVPPAQHTRFMGVWFAHLASYLVGIGGGAWLIHRFWRERGRPRVFQVLPSDRTGWGRLAVLSLLFAAVLGWRLDRLE